MDYLRILRVPFHITTLLMIGVITPLMTLCLWGMLNTPAAFAGFLGAFFLQIWVLKWCYVLVDKMANGAREPPVMDMDMLSPMETRPWLQLGLLGCLAWACWSLHGTARFAVAIFTFLWFPASVALLGVGERPWSTLNPLTLFRLMRGLGVHYLVLLAGLSAGIAIVALLAKLSPALVLWVVVLLFYQVAFFALVGGVVFARRRQLGFEAGRSPERAAAREDAERAKVRAHMLDEVFQQVRIGKNIEATRPLAKWFAALDGETAARDAQFIAAQALQWGFAASLNTIGSTLIRHLLRAGRPDAALAIFESLRAQAPGLTLDSADDLRTLIDFAESHGRDDLAASMRLETPIYHP
jgi:pentatricopeptide repeat protein